ncbi:amino acid ABC transporter substrate-binding protein [Pseudomonas sp. Leaf127]|uniref:substrate-binding periplasmic protein n=1 Tax=Pseudomonas sp. Leaf127 TaxID=1736267 RepID=UPI000703AF43|nr:transporter substrate-binding domain-containing protein [Pseudomonas sp. Leaf127]KQQ54475.1 amino acid ABC transporter substrate-binding protein [Pseudomonas sp. Leaf127]
MRFNPLHTGVIALKSLLLSLLLAGLPVRAANEPPLRFSVSESWSMPLIHIEGHQPTTGILFDIMHSLARQVGRTPEFHVLPRLRVQTALALGEIDIRCYTSPAWLSSLSGDYFWSLPILTQRDMLLASPETAGPYPEQFDNEVVGTVLGYTYPELQHLFDNHNLLREDARNEEQVLRKLVAGRYNYAVGSQLAMDWINRELPARRRLKIVSLISEQPAGCMIRNDPALPAQKILRTLLRMKMSGELQQIVDRYTALPGNETP